MPHPMPLAARLAVAMALVCGAIGCGAGETREQSLPLGPAGLLIAEFDFGDGLRPDPGFVRIGSHDRDEVRVEIEASGFGAWGVASRLEADGRDRARLDVRIESAVAWMFGGPRLQIRVLAPRGAALDVRSSGGELRIDDVEGAVRARSRDARVELRGIEGPVHLRSLDGQVQIEDVAGPLEVTGSGEVECAFVRGAVAVRQSRGEIALRHVDGRIVAKTLDGRIDLEEIAGPVDARTERGSVLASFRGEPEGSLETERGSVEARFPDTSGADVDARATDGEVEIDARLALDGELTPSEARGRVGAGGPLLRLRTTRGNVRVGAR